MGWESVRGRRESREGNWEGVRKTVRSAKAKWVFGNFFWHGSRRHSDRPSLLKRHTAWRIQLLLHSNVSDTLGLFSFVEVLIASRTCLIYRATQTHPRHIPQVCEQTRQRQSTFERIDDPRGPRSPLGVASESWPRQRGSYTNLHSPKFRSRIGGRPSLCL